MLSLASGYGGLEVALGLLFPDATTVCYVEREGYAAANLVARFQDQTLDPAPIWDDVKTFDGKPWRGKVDWVTAGYPCQPFSIAGRKQGAGDPRHLWPSIKGIIQDIQPEFCFFENVPHHVNLGLDEVGRDLQSLGYSTAAILARAESVGAPHARERLFILAYTESGQERVLSKWDQLLQTIGRNALTGDSREELADSPDVRLPKIGEQERGLPSGNEPLGCDSTGGLAHPVCQFPPGRDPDNPRWREWPWPSYQPGFRRGSAGSITWNDRLRLAGNGVVPLQAAYALLSILADLQQAWAQSTTDGETDA